MWQIGPITFHAYGLLVGLAVVLVWHYVLALAAKHQQQEPKWRQWLSIFFITLVAARLWHVLTDLSVYIQAWQHGVWWQAIAVWQGGLSILGGFVGLVIGVRWVFGKQWLWWLDAVSLALPLGQAVGRLANWVNQELYGLPTSLPWGLAIDQSHRLSAVSDLDMSVRFHPLFAYEAIGTLLLWLVLSRLQRRVGLGFGTGNIVLMYILGYSSLRFMLDFLRIDRSHIWFGMGINQWVLLLVLIWVVGVLYQKLRSIKIK